MDDFVEKHTSFVTRSKPRRDFMSGREGRFSQKFWMQAPMFLPGTHKSAGRLPAHLHPWVIAADKASYSFRANPRPPVIYGRKEGISVPIQDCDPNHLCPGDVVSVTFNVVYYLTDKDWHPQYQPVEVYLLKRADGDGWIDYEDRPACRTPPATMSAPAVEGMCNLTMLIYI